MIKGNYSREFSDGWNNLFEKLLAELEPYDVEIGQVKEKYGTLNVYAYSETNNEEAQRIIDKYEEKSKHICELCGKKGEMKTLSGDWLKVLCEKCEEKIESEGSNN